ncbi:MULTISPECIES: DUF5803 family protein [Halococcus]|uniref:Lipoprotein n=1 Tax=Halococcus salifodinae DSM 8989 TaxID=1227456 RepID=M0MZ15_9EURY|nr:MULTISPECIES: DUF5803 family protein [Halococcus]EMA50099.1 hypothetical protein C450_15383 [Halococcus salifodinae DSM 8989]
MTRRRLLAFGLVVAFVALAGCSSVFGSGGGDAAANASYDWETNGTNATINVTGGRYTAVYNVSNESTFPVFQRNELGQNQPLPVSALQFQYPNGTVVTPSESSGLNVTSERERAVINLPAKNGKVAFTASAQGKRLGTRTFVEGTYEVTIPKGMRVDYEPLARVSPGGYTADRTADDRVRLTWENVDSSSVVVRYYLQRDLYLFIAGAAVLVLVAAGGALYYLRQIKELERQRKDVGPDIDTGSVDDDDGPPGFG